MYWESLYQKIFFVLLVIFRCCIIFKIWPKLKKWRKSKVSFTTILKMHAIFDSGNTVLRKTFTPPLPHPPQKNGPEMSSKSRITIYQMYLLKYGLAAIGTWSAHQTKSNNKHCQKPNKKLPNANPYICTNNIRHVKCAPKVWFLSFCVCFLFNFFSYFLYSVLLNTFSHSLILSHSVSHFFILSHTFTYFLILSHSFSYFHIISQTFSFLL